MKLVKAVQTSKKSTFESKEIRSLVKLDFSRLLIHPALKRRLLKKISSVVTGFCVSAYQRFYVSENSLGIQCSLP